MQRFPFGRCCSERFFHGPTPSSAQLGAVLIYPPTWLRTMRHRKVRGLSQSHTARKQGSLDATPGSRAHVHGQSMLLSPQTPAPTLNMTLDKFPPPSRDLVIMGRWDTEEQTQLFLFLCAARCGDWHTCLLAPGALAGNRLLYFSCLVPS